MSQFNTRCQIIHFFDDNLTVLLKQLRKFQKENKNATTEGSSIFTIALEDDKNNKNIETEIYLLGEMGLTELIFIKEKRPFC